MLGDVLLLLLSLGALGVAVWIVIDWRVWHAELTGDENRPAWRFTP